MSAVRFCAGCAVFGLALAALAWRATRQDWRMP